ncbi:STAS domain-containing protein [Xylanimonas ulmi]|uniref:Anti-anti-sigma factor n=1 Tax=Xylanimonas ulmi TaxID=228973 RepID=A0A4Q7M382_9MICO|nr:STAS domain-containing protein [Xylanibacterium ulmi]RZS62366.1 anti-anti-sigma factor [Xylanibacterium ulmi]
MIEIATSSTTTTLVITGDLDLAERDQFPEIASRVVGLRRQLLVIDMCHVTFMDSTGAAFLISLADSGRKRGGATVLRGADERDLFVLEVCGALEMFRIDRDHTCEGATPGPEGFIRPQAQTPPTDGAATLPQRRRSASS